MSPTNKKKHGKSKTTTTVNILPTDTSSPTRVAFRDFIELADVDTINSFLAATTFTLESENLELLWKRAYKEGFENGQKAIQPVLQRVGRKMEEKFEKGVARGMDLGREEGYTVAKEGFDNMVKALKAREAAKADITDTSSQTDTPAPISIQNKPTASVPCQTDTTFIPTTLSTTIGIQTSPYRDITCHSSTLTTPIVQTDSDTTLTTLTFVKSGNDESNTPRSTQSGYQGCPELENRSPLDADTSRASESTSLNMEPNAFVLGPKTPVTMTGFTQKHLKMRKSPIFNKRHDGLSEAATTEHSAALSESSAGSTVVLASENPSKTAEFSQKRSETTKLPVSEAFNWADEAETLYTSPTFPQHPPRDFSGLRSSSVNPFSSLRRRRGYHKNSRCFINTRSQPKCQHIYPNYHHYSSTRQAPHHIPQPRFAVSLNWDKDPRLADLGTALRALGWIRA
jgi:hypothetical protein